MIFLVQFSLKFSFHQIKLTILTSTDFTPLKYVDIYWNNNATDKNCSDANLKLNHNGLNSSHEILLYNKVCLQSDCPPMIRSFNFARKERMETLYKAEREESLHLLIHILDLKRLLKIAK